MNKERNSFPEHLTFSQRYDYEPLPTPMLLEEVSDDLRREVWNTVRAFLLGISVKGQMFRSDEKRLIERVLGKITKQPESRIRTEFDFVMTMFERIIIQMEFHHVLSLLELIIYEHYQSEEFADEINRLFSRHAAAYWLDMSRHPYWFFPRTSKEQGEATQHAIEIVHQHGMVGAVKHLREAGRAMNERRYPDSVRESIHAVESVARVIDPKSSKTLTPALKSLEMAGVLEHSALREAFEKLYGYTSDEQGVRHALLDQEFANVGIDEAMFMFGACASFTAYLTEKQRKTGNT